MFLTNLLQKNNMSVRNAEAQNRRSSSRPRPSPT
jgi:hypothetical protein